MTVLSTYSEVGLFRDLPPWVIFHIPHDSTVVPIEARTQISLTDRELNEELIRMTDHLTFSMFAAGVPETQVVRATVSRLVVDVERFEDDNFETMASRGMGAVYTATSGLTPLRCPISAEEREALMHAYYYPHHARLEAAVSAAVDRFGRCLVIDCHSFPNVALPYEMTNRADTRPDICIGTDEFHTDAKLADAFVSAFQHEGWHVRRNDPFEGALVPASRYRRDRRVSAIMVEINRALYLQEECGLPLPIFLDIAQRIRRCCMSAIDIHNKGGEGS